jgi:hypothetical protein
VAAHAWATWHQTTCQNDATCHIMIRPHIPINDYHIINYHVIVQTCHIIVRPLPRQHPYELYCQHIFFTYLTIQTDRDISLIHVCLNPNELRWVRNNEGYAPVHFEAIPRTLIFELNFDPWSRF